MDLSKKYQPGIRKHSFYELQDVEESVPTEEGRRFFGDGTVVRKVQNEEPCRGAWIGIGDIKRPMPTEEVDI